MINGGTVRGAFQYGRAGLRLLETAYAVGRLGTSRWSGKALPTPQRLRIAFESLGATYVKIGQFIASAPSLFPHDFVVAFQDCLDRTPPLPYSVIQRVVREELGRDPSECFASIDCEPLASASVAQVHAARLRSGEEVVLKVQKPGVDFQLQTDVKAIRLAMRALEYFYPTLTRTGVSAIAEDMESTFEQECDFRVEARRMRDFAEFLRRLRLYEAVVPRVHEELSTRRLLIMERLHGEPLTADLSAVRDRNRLAAAVAGALNVWVSSVTHCEFFHADIHAGNLLILKDGRVGFIDFGIVGTVEPKSWQAALALVTALLRADARGVAQSLIQVGATNGTVSVEPLAADLDGYLKRFSRASRSGPSGEGDTPDRLLVEIFAAGGKYGLHFPRELFLLLKQYLYLDRYLRVISPGLVDIFSFGSLGRRVFG
jgi:predicted unusual protein kinase regulating ubiquinone biosynthesis (AarF/ABC1/UbiB family)